MELDFYTYILKVGAAALAGALMGLERKVKDKPAGLKTYTLVAIGAATFVAISLLFKSFQNTDMTRIIGQIVVGVGFLGSGVILHNEEKTKVKGLATSATIWCSAAAGCLAGFSLYMPLLGLTIFVVLVNILFGFLNSKVEKETDDVNSEQ
mgnify:CR=1 FL=1